MILPSHGPVHKNPDYILDLYEEWTDDKTKNLVLLPYVSMYGSVLEMVDYLAKKFENAGIMAKKFDIVEGDLGEYAMDLVDANTIILGASTVLAGPHPAAMSGAYLTGVLAPKAKNLSIVGSYGWNGKLVELLAQNLVDIKKQLADQNLKISEVNIELYQDDTTFFKQKDFEGEMQGRQNGQTNVSESNRVDSVAEEELVEEKMATDDSNINFLA